MPDVYACLQSELNFETHVAFSFIKYMVEEVRFGFVKDFMCVCMCVYVYSTCVWIPVEDRRRQKIPRTGVIGGESSPV